MALDTGAYPAEARLILTPTSYASGGTDLGLVGDFHQAGFGYHATLLSNLKFGEQFTGGRVTGINLVYRILLLEQSNSVMSLMFGDGATSAQDHWEWFESYKLGHPVEETTGMLKQILIRPTDTSHPYLYIPKGFVFQLGPIQWDRRENVYSGTEILVAALYDETRSTNVHFGNVSNLTAI